MYTASMLKITEYYAFSEEVERIMTNMETTDQFKAAHRRWANEKGKEPRVITTVTTSSQTAHTTTRVDADGDTIMAPTKISDGRSKHTGNRRDSRGKQKAKWVDAVERERRREQKLCFRCGGSGHRIRDCAYEPATRPTNIMATNVGPLLEDPEEDPDSAISIAGKE